MANSAHVYRVHPAIGVVRVGNSEEYYLAPETMAGFPQADSATTGGLPIRAGTESESITSRDLRDRSGALKRQAARFKIYQYPKQAFETYPNGGGTEIVIGSVVDGKKVIDIIWTVHLANKKANAYVLNDDLGMQIYDKAHTADLLIRNSAQGPDLNNAARLKRLVIDPGPRAIRGSSREAVRFDKPTLASFWDSGNHIKELGFYPKSFPDDNFTPMYTPVGKIETLGELQTDDQGHLIVAGGYGKACGWCQPDGTPFPLSGDQIVPGVYGDVNGDGWFDDTGDGPVSATLVFADGSVQEAHGAWVIAAAPGYAPQIPNIISMWDDMFDSWVRKLNLCPRLFKSRFRDNYVPFFEDDLYPIFLAVALQRWTTNFPERAITAHDAVGRISATDDPGDTILTGLAFIRDPNNPRQFNIGAPFMPLSMGDASKAFLTVTRTQYFFLTQWNNSRFERGAGPKLGPGEFLDKATLVNCLGGRLDPGIEMSFIMRDPEIYIDDWESSGGGPFRLRKRPLDYNKAQYSHPFLTVGYIPMHPGPDPYGPRSAPMEPGDVTKFMAIPWHSDYSACATHNQAPNPTNSSTLYWSWPAQRPVQIHAAKDVHNGKLGPQLYSIRGAGTYSDDPGLSGRYQNLIDMVLNWYKIGVVIQGSTIEGDTTYSPEQYLEVESQLDEPEITPWPMNSIAIGT